MGQAKQRGTFEQRKAEAIRLKKKSYKKNQGEILFRSFAIPDFAEMAGEKKRTPKGPRK